MEDIFRVAMTPKIVSIGFAVPEASYSQEEVLWMLGYTSPLSRRIFTRSGIDKRHLWTVPVRGESWQELCQEYQKGAIELSRKAVISCMDGRPLSDIGCLVFGSCTGYTCPGISHHLARELGMPDNMVHANLLGQGCEAAGPSLARAVDHFMVHGTPALIVCCEICSCAFFNAPESDLENVVTNCLFGDAAAAMLVGSDSEPNHPEVVDIQSYFDSRYMDYLGFRWVDGRLKCILNRDVPRASGILIDKAVARLLAKHGLSVPDIDFWAIHPGGVRVLEHIQASLGLSDEKLEPSYNVLREFGNVSSATVIILGKQLNQITGPAWGVGVTMGAGFEVNTCLLRWGGSG